MTHQVVPRGRRSVRRLLFALALLVAMTTLLGASLAPAAAQNPNKPVTEDVNVTFLAPNLTRICGFDVWANVSGTLTFQSQPGGVMFQRFRYVHTFTGPGGSVSVNRVENAKFTLTVLPDGTEVEDVSTAGTLMYHMVIPGYGSIANNSGREVLQLTWQYDAVENEWVIIDEQVLFDAGPNDGLSDEDFAVICDQLA